MDMTLSEALRIAVEAIQVPESDRDKFLAQRCEADNDLRDALRSFLGELQEGRSDQARERIQQDTVTLDLQVPANQNECLEHEGTATLSEPEHSLVEQVCQQFVSAWASGTTPDLSEFIPRDLDTSLREYFVYRLVAIDVAERARRDIPSDEQDYVSKLPEYQNAIHSALTRRSGARIHHQLNDTLLGDEGGSRGDFTIDTRSSTGMQASVHRYQLVNLHARGGLGEVYLAKDMELGRVVALKRIRRDRKVDTDQDNRFVFEAEVTGSLEHPGIVPVYSLSKRDPANPYYTMRFIRGISLSDAIKDFHRANPSPVSATYYERDFRQLLRRLIDVCNAVHYAHERGVLHRDLKPDNIMLGRYGETLVVDWGLARLRTQPAPEVSPTDASELPMWWLNGMQTRTGSIVGTPPYMSPEQAFGLHDELTPASDVYSLGAILFNIICNENPIEGKTLQEVVSNVRSGKRRELANVAPAAPPPLDSICRRAMAKDPQQRYASAVELADDLDRWMSDDRVNAHAASERILETAGRLLRRHRSWTVSGALALLAIALVSTVSAGVIQRAKHNESLARQREHQFKQEAVARYRDSRDAIDQWLVQSSSALRFFPGTHSVRMQLLKLASEDYAKLSSVNSEDWELELERGRAMMRLGDLHQMRDEYVAARSRYDQAIGLFSAAVGLDHAQSMPAQLQTQYAAESANVVARIAMSYANEERAQDALEHYGESIRQLRSLQESSADPAVTRYLASAQINAGELLLRISQLDDGQQKLIEGRDNLLSLEEQASLEDRMGIARCEELLGRLESHRGNHELALNWFRTSSDRIVNLVSQAPDHLDFRDALASTSISAASAQRSLGQDAEERQALADAVASYRALLEAMPDAPPYQENLAITLTDLGLALLDADHCRDSRQELEEARDLCTDLTKRYPNAPRYQDQLAASLDALGQSLLGTGEWEPAKNHLAEAIQIYQTLSQDFPERADYLERLAVAQSHLAQVLATTTAEDDTASVETVSGGFRAASATLNELMDVFPEVPRYQNEAAYVAYYHAWFLHDRDDPQAETMFQSARDRWESMAERRDPTGSERLAWLLTTCPVESVRDAAKAVEVATDAVAKSPSNPRFQCTLAMAQLGQGDVAGAASTLSKTLEVALPKGRQSFAIAQLRFKQGDTAAAAKARDQALAWFEIQAPHHHDFLLLRSLLGELHSD